MTRRCAPKVLLALLAATLPALSSAGCFPVAGSVRLLPDPTCAVQSSAPGVVFTGQCFSVNLALIGFPTGTGYAGTTVEPLAGANGVPTTTPAVIPVDGQPTLPRQMIQTARSVITLGQAEHRRRESTATTLYTTDVIVFQPKISSTGEVTPGATVEQILIAGTDGKGAYAGTTGHLTITGNSIGTPAPVVGRLCMP